MYRRYLTAAVFSAAVATPCFAAATSGPAIAFVIQEKAAAATHAADMAIEKHLTGLGYTVHDVDQSAPASAVRGNRLVLISSSISAHKLEAKYAKVDLPVVTWESYLLPQMGMSGLKEDGDFGTIAKNRYLWMVNAPHPLSAGLGHGLRNVVKRGASMNWGKPGLGATIIATLPGAPDKVLEFAYEKGATMDYENIAPARRVFLFLDNDTFTDLNASGVKLFDAAVAWAAAEPKSSGAE